MSETSPPKTVHELLHRLWTKAVDTPNYFKGDWRLLELALARKWGPDAELPADAVRELWRP